MTAHLTLETRSDVVRRLVADFARGLGYALEFPDANGQAIRIELPESSEVLFEVMTHIALCATKANVDVNEPLCRVTVRHTTAATEVSLGLRIAEFTIGAPEPAAN